MFGSSSKFSKAFFGMLPPPKFLEMPAVGLHIGNSAIRFIDLERKNAGFIPSRFAERKIPEGVMEAGYIKKPEELKKILISLKSEFGLRFVNASLPEERAYLFKTQTPKVSHAEIREILEFRLEENVPLSGGEAVFDFNVLPFLPNSSHLDISVTVLPSDFVASYTELLNQSGLTPLSFQVEAQAVSRAVITKDDPRTFLLANIGESRSSLAIVRGDVVYFSSTVSAGGRNIREVLRKHYGVSEGEAENLKKEIGFAGNKKYEAVYSGLSGAISSLKDEINKIINYWRTHQAKISPVSKNDIAGIILCGHDSGLDGFLEYIESETKTKTEVGNVWKNTFSLEDYVPPISFLDSLDYAAAIGLALPKE